MGVTQQLAEFAIETPASFLTPSIIESARLKFLDTLSIMIAGSQHAAARDMGGNADASIVGHTDRLPMSLFVGITGTLAINASLYAKLPCDPVRDFAPIILVATGPNILVVHPSLPAHNVKELIALAKSKPGGLSYASAGTGGAPHLAGELFKSMAQVDIVHVPYRGGSAGDHRPACGAGRDDVRGDGRRAAVHQGGKVAAARGGRCQTLIRHAGIAHDRRVPEGF